MAFILFSPLLLLYAFATNNNKLVQKIEWKRKHGYLNVWKTFLVNFSSFKPSVARKFPIIVYEDLDFINYGEIIIESETISRGMLSINPITWRSKSVTRIENYGVLRLTGNNIRIFGGSKIIIRGGCITLDEGCSICENTLIFCEKEIKIGKRTDLSFDSIVTDTNNHFLVNIDNGIIHSQVKAVEIGDFNWIGNNTSIKPGCKTPHHTIVAASYSVLTKDYTLSISPYSVIGGCPAKLIKEGVSRIWDVKKETELLQKSENELSVSKEFIKEIITSIDNY